MTREEVVEIMNYCKEHKVTYKSRLEELNIPVWRFYDSKSRYAAEQSSGKSAQGEFIELPHSGSFVPVPSFAGTSGRKQKNAPIPPSGLKFLRFPSYKISTTLLLNSNMSGQSYLHPLAKIVNFIEIQSNTIRLHPESSGFLFSLHRVTQILL